MDAELIAALVEATLAGTGAVLLVSIVRRPVRVVLGAGAAYALWLCVPAALMAVLLPRGIDPSPAWPASWRVAPASALLPNPQRDLQAWRDLALLLWLGGTVPCAAILAWQQHRYVRGLGKPVRRDDGLYQCPIAGAGLPAVAGALRPRILLPADFARRYTAQEQALVIEHERVHVRRGDPLANALAAALRCLFWFHPLLPMALRRFRLDQELACDARVIARNPQARHAYGQAMLKTQFDELPLPLGCHWQARHPIKERIDMLKHPVPTGLSRTLAALLAVALSASTGYAAWAAQPAGSSLRSVPGSTPAVMASKLPPPRYPVEAAQQYIGGKVMLLVTVDTDGSVAEVEVEQTSPAGVFDAPAVEAARQWRFQPATENGRPARSQVRVPITFEAKPAEVDGGAG